MYSAGGVVCDDVTHLLGNYTRRQKKGHVHTWLHAVVVGATIWLLFIFFNSFSLFFLGFSTFSLLQATTELLFFSCLTLFFSCFDLFTVTTLRKLLLRLCYFFTFFVTLLNLTAIIFFPSHLIKFRSELDTTKKNRFDVKCFHELCWNEMGSNESRIALGAWRLSLLDFH